MKSMDEIREVTEGLKRQYVNNQMGNFGNLERENLISYDYVDEIIEALQDAVAHYDGLMKLCKVEDEVYKEHITLLQDKNRFLQLNNKTRKD